MTVEHDASTDGRRKASRKFKEEMHRLTSTELIAEIILTFKIHDFQLLTPQQQQMIALHVLSDEEDLDILMNVAEILPELLLNFYEGDLSAEEVVNSLMVATKRELRSYLTEVYSEIVDQLILEGAIIQEPKRPRYS